MTLGPAKIKSLEITCKVLYLYTRKSLVDISEYIQTYFKHIYLVPVHYCTCTYMCNDIVKCTYAVYALNMCTSILTCTAVVVLLSQGVHGVQACST